MRIALFVAQLVGRSLNAMTDALNVQMAVSVTSYNAAPVLCNIYMTASKKMS